MLKVVGSNDGLGRFDSVRTEPAPHFGDPAQADFRRLLRAVSDAQDEHSMRLQRIEGQQEQLAEALDEWMQVSGLMIEAMGRLVRTLKEID